MTEKSVLVCHRVADIPLEHVAGGSLIKKCDTCRKDVWASKASLIHSGGEALMCICCFVKLPPKNRTKLVKPSEGQLREIEEHERTRKEE